MKARSNYHLGLLAGMLLFPLPSISSAFQDEPSHFRGIKWGINVNDIPGLKFLVGYEEAKSYQRRNDKMRMGDAKIDSVSYIFYKDKFCSVYIGFRGRLNFQKIKEILIERHGEPHRPNETMETYIWRGDVVDIAFRYKEEISKKGSLIYWFKPIMQEKILDEKKKAAKRRPTN
ncbi:MAG: hypothetical protein PVG99_10340 [Desulfobacteraceae bacterium]|jgi:hypothetical protein